MGSDLDILQNTEGKLFSILLKGRKISLPQQEKAQGAGLDMRQILKNRKAQGQREKEQE
jgi:hypothetical protein